MTKKITKQIAVNLPTSYWLVLKLHTWDMLDIASTNPEIPIQFKMRQPQDGNIGFLPVYDTKENALKYCSQEEYVAEIRPTVT